MTSDADQSFITEALPAFISEAQEQIQSLEQLLLELEDNPGDRELLDALFRCAHTVKGSAGIFGLDRVVAFTHHVETLLDLVREGQLVLTPALSTLLLQCNDQIRLLVGQAYEQDVEEDADALANRNDLVQQLQAAAGGSATTAAALPPALSVVPQASAAAPTSVHSQRWHVSVGFGTDVFRNGMDPLALLGYLRGLGDMPQLVCDMDAIPPLDQIDPESCHLRFELGLVSQASRADIEGAFSFVRDDCQLTILEPGASTNDFADLIEATPGNPRLSELLIAAGAITQEQLLQGLRTQAPATLQGVTVANALVQQTALGPVPMDGGATTHPSTHPARQAKQTRPRDGSAAATPATGDDQRFIRVQADRLDDVINLLGELVIAGAGASLLARQSRQGAMIEANQQITRLIEEIRNGTLQLRMVPIGETFSRFRRVVRDTAAELGKDVVLEIVGGETELDKSVVERIADPLMHLVRNALDHGLETPQARRAEGKPMQGTLTLSACHESGSILIRIADNGRGIQRAKVLQRAWERGLVEPGVHPADADIDRLIFEPGFSTAETVTNLSGRGVGMDVVRRNIEALRGSVSISSNTGQGSCIEIRLPLTLAIIDGFLVGVGPSRFIFPLDSVVEVIESSNTATAVDTRGRSCVELRGQVLPVVDLRMLYDLDTPPPERCSIVVVRSGSTRYGVLVDQLLGQHQTVIKPLGRLLGSLRGMSGSSILGTGEVALIFDVGSLGQLAAAQPPVPVLTRIPSSPTAASALPSFTHR